MKKSGKAVVAVLLCIVLSGSGLYTVEASGGETSKKNDEKYSELQNRLPEMLTGMDENGDVYSVDTESGIVENGQSKARTAEAKVVNFNTKGFSDTTTYTEVETGNSGYTCGAYGADAAYLGTNGTKVRFMLAGVIGEVEGAEVQLVDYSQAKTISHYLVSGGRLIHKITSNLNNTSYVSSLDQGAAPAYLSEGKKYFSYDGHYFYPESAYENMLGDYVHGNRENAINKTSPFFNYYQYLPLRSKSSYSGTMFNTMLNNQVTATSKMRNIGEKIVECQNNYGTNALLVTGVAANESAWGTSNISQTKNNLFGLNAVDSSPGQSANYYDTVETCLKDFSETYMSKQYLNPNNWKYCGAFLGNKASGINVRYASDPYWGEKAANAAWVLDKKSGNADQNKYSIGIKDLLSSDHTALNVRKEASTTSERLYNTGAYATYSFLIIGEDKDFYKVQSDPVLSTDRTTIDNGSGKYNFSAMYAFSSKAYISKVNSGTDTETKPPIWDVTGMEMSAPSPQLMNTKIKLNAKISGTAADLQYKFVWMKDNWAKWGVIKDFSNEASCTWNADDAGSYTLYLDVKDSTGKTVSISSDYTIKNWGMTGIQTSPAAPQSPGTSITISPKMLGTNSLLKYKFVWMKDNWSKWGVIQEFSSKKEAVWKPNEEGEYQLFVDVEDETGTKVSYSMEYMVKHLDWSFEGIGFDKASPQEAGTTVNVTADLKNADSNLEYKFVWVIDNWKEWGVIQDFSKSNTAKWTPVKAGSYQIYVDVRDAVSGRIEHRNVSYEIQQGNWKISGIQMTPDQSQKIGGEVQIKANAAGNLTGLKYKFVWQKNNWKEWGVISDFSDKNTTVWKPASEGIYEILTDVKDLSGKIVTARISYLVVKKNWKLEEVSINQNSPQEIGTVVKISPKVSGNAENLEYKYVWMRDGWKEWGVIKDFSADNSMNWIPEVPGDYTLYVDVRENDGSNSESNSISFKALPGTWEISGINFDVPEPQAKNTEILLAAGIIGNKTGLQYKYVWMKDNWKSWGVIQDQGTLSKASWKPTEAGKYKIYLDVSDICGKQMTCVREYEIVDTKIVTNPLNTGNVGSTVLISIEGITHNKNMRYKYVWMKDNWAKWEVIQDFSESQMVRWTPKEKGEYTLYVDIKNIATNEIVTQKVVYTVK